VAASFPNERLRPADALAGNSDFWVCVLIRVGISAPTGRAVGQRRFVLPVFWSHYGNTKTNTALFEELALSRIAFHSSKYILNSSKDSKSSSSSNNGSMAVQSRSANR
jgi:hypothetical protein